VIDLYLNSPLYNLVLIVSTGTKTNKLKNSLIEEVNKGKR